MPIVGEVRSGKELGYQVKRTNRKISWVYSDFIWSKCQSCGKGRWIRVDKIKRREYSGLCKKCSDTCLIERSVKSRGDKNPNWKGGRWKDANGYIWVHLYPDNFFFPMANTRFRIKEHRLIMAEHLKRCLLPWEVVHHKNGIRDDNRIGNLQLLPSNKWHLIDSEAKRYMKKLEQRIALLEKKLEEAKATINMQISGQTVFQEEAQEAMK